MSEDDSMSDCEPLLGNELLQSGIGLGKEILACETLAGRDVFYVERYFGGLVKVDSVTAEPTHVAITLRFRCTPQDHDEGSVAYEYRTVRYPQRKVRMNSQVLRMGGEYGVSSDIVHNPGAILHMLDVARSAESLQDLYAAVERIDESVGWSKRATAQEFEEAPESDIGGPTCRVGIGRGIFALQFRNLPIANGRCLAWASEWPVTLIMAACQACFPLAPNLTRDLLQLEQAHSRAHPDAMPALARNAKELFAKKPGLALMFHERYRGISLNGNLTDDDFIRLLREITSLCGIRLDATGLLPSPEIIEASANLRRMVKPGCDPHTVIVGASR